jgi:WhiB family redox-sensing transcriptional regulator
VSGAAVGEALAERLEHLIDDRLARADSGGTPWQQFALCRGRDPDLWFPTEPGDSPAAVNICSACPVRSDCLCWAIEHNERHGIWGGVSARRRQRMRAGTIASA